MSNEFQVYFCVICFVESSLTFVYRMRQLPKFKSKLTFLNLNSAWNKGISIKVGTKIELARLVQNQN